MSNKPLLSVCIITYNHEDYIGQAIESVLMQRCSFLFEIIIGVDFSSDRTEEICLKFAESYSNIKVLTTNHRIGMMSNFLRTVNTCAGEYIAMLEGDDYWNVTNKLQKQIEFLELHKDFILCFHNRDHIEGDLVSEKLLCSYGQDRYFEGPEVLYITIHTLTVVFRNVLKQHPYPKEFYHLPLYDFALWAFLSLYGKFAYLDFNGATYRIHPNGYYSSAETVLGYRRWMYCQQVVKRYFPENYQKNFSDFILMLNFMITEELRKQGKYGSFCIDTFRLSMRSIKWHSNQYVKFYYSLFKSETKKQIKKLLLISVAYN